MIPDVEDDPNETNIKAISQPPQMIGKIQNLSEINQTSKHNSLPQNVKIL